MRSPLQFLPVIATAAAILGSGAACAQDPRPEAKAPTVTSWLASARPLTRGPDDYESLATAARGKRFVLLGEDTHGTAEFYLERARITERLIRDGAVTAVAIEADGPEVERVNRYVRGLSDETWNRRSATCASFPRGCGAMRSSRVRRAAQGAQPGAPARTSGRALRHGRAEPGRRDRFGAGYLDRTDPAAAARARVQYRCFPREGRSEEAYGLAARRPKSTCEEQARTVLAEFVTRTVPTIPPPPKPCSWPPPPPPMSLGRRLISAPSTRGCWLGTSATAHGRRGREHRTSRGRLTGRPGQVVAWAHNTHVGDARATDARYRGEINLGQCAGTGGAGRPCSWASSRAAAR
jgi:hypothetical protein